MVAIGWGLQPDKVVILSLAPDVSPTLVRFRSLANEVNKTPRVGLTSGARLSHTHEKHSLVVRL